MVFSYPKEKEDFVSLSMFPLPIFDFLWTFFKEKNLFQGINILLWLRITTHGIFSQYLWIMDSLKVWNYVDFLQNFPTNILSSINSSATKTRWFNDQVPLKFRNPFRSQSHSVEKMCIDVSFFSSVSRFVLTRQFRFFSININIWCAIFGIR